MLEMTLERSQHMEARRHLITEADRLRLSSLLESGEFPDSAEEALRDKLGHLTPVETKTTPRDLVTMNAMIRGVVQVDGALDSSNVHMLTLTYPHAADMSEGFVSVLSPLGLDLLGAREGHVVTWSRADGHFQNLLIDKVVFQPESSRDWHL